MYAVHWIVTYPVNDVAHLYRETGATSINCNYQMSHGKKSTGKSKRRFNHSSVMLKVNVEGKNGRAVETSFTFTCISIAWVAFKKLLLPSDYVYHKLYSYMVIGVQQ